MVCRDFDDIVSAALRSLTLTPEAKEHLNKCRICRALATALDEAGEPAAPRETSLKRIEARIMENLKPVRPLASSRVFFIACAFIFLFTVAAGAMLAGIKGWGALSLVQRAGIFAALATSARLLAASMVAQMAPGSKYTFAPETLPIMISMALLVVLAVAFQPREE